MYIPWVKQSIKGIESLPQPLISIPKIFATQCRRPNIFKNKNSVK